MGLLSRVKTWITGETLTASDLNAEFDNILNGMTPTYIEDASADNTAMRATTDPYPASSESLATTLLGEIQRIRYVLAQITGKTYWYQDPDATIATLAQVTPAGIVQAYIGSTAPTGWLLAAGGSIGDASSGASARANADTVTLFTLMWNSWDAAFQIYEPAPGGASTKGASAAADFAAHKRIVLPDLRGRTIIGLDNMGGSSANRITDASADILGGGAGAESHLHTTGDVTLSAAQSGLPAHTHDVLQHQSPSNQQGDIIGGVNASSFTTTTGAVTGGAAAASSAHNHGNTQTVDHTMPYLTLNYIIKF